MSIDINNKKDQEIWNSFIKGDKNALSFIYFENFDMLLNFGIKYSSDRNLVEDCIQNLFIDLIKRQKDLIKVTDVRFYLMKALRNQISSEYRKNKKLYAEEAVREEFEITYSIENDIILKEQDKMRESFLKMVNEKLTSRQKEALYLKFNCDLDYPQIAEIMKVSIESSRTLIYRTIKTIRENFTTDYGSKLFFMIFGDLRFVRCI